MSSRDGPNVRQSFDAAWADYEQAPWRVIGFWSRPVDTRDLAPFDDTSDRHLQYGGLRIERQGLGPGDLAVYYSRYVRDGAAYLDATGDERRNNFDAHYSILSGGFDADAEAMLQTGKVGHSDLFAWAFGSRSGYTFADLPWTPRLGFQADAGSGDGRPRDGHLGTFNPLFPNGYYFNLAGTTSYANLLHAKPSLTLHPTALLTLTSAVAFQWRETTADAVYVQPNIPVSGTAGHGSRWTGLYEQLRVDWVIDANLSGAIEAVHFAVGDTVRQAGGRDTDYLGAEMRLAW